MTKKLILFKNKLKLEEAQAWVKYKFTLNPDYGKDIENLDQFQRYIKKWLSSFKNANFTYCIEISPTGRYHLHGYIILTNIREFYNNELKFLSSINGLLGVEDPEFKGKMSWPDYCYKQQHIIGIGWETVTNVMEVARQFKDVKLIPNDKMGFPTISNMVLLKEPTTPLNSPEFDDNSDCVSEPPNDGYDIEDVDDSDDDTIRD